MSDCDHAPGDHPAQPFWFADILEESERGYSEPFPWAAFIQLGGMVDRISTTFSSEEDALAFIRDNLLIATTVCDD